MEKKSVMKRWDLHMHLLTYEPIIAVLPEAVLDEWRKQPWLEPELQTGCSLAEALCRPASLQRALEFLSSDEREVMRLIVTMIGVQPFSLEPLIQAAVSRLGGAEVEAGLIGLRRKGLIGTFRKSWGELLFVLPWSGFCAWRKLLLPEQNQLLATVDLQHGNTDSLADQRGLAQLVFMLLLTAALEPMEITRRGNLNKRAIQRLYKAASWPDDALRLMRIPYVFSDIYQPGLAIVLDFAISRRLLTRSEDRLVINNEAVWAWMELGVDCQNAELYRYWLTIAMPSDVRMQHIIACIEDLPTGRAAIVSPSETWQAGDTAHSEGESAWLEQLYSQWLQPLAAFGWLELEFNQDRELTLRSKLDPKANESTGSADKKFYVQPDFEIIVPPGVPIVTRWQAALMAELISWDELMVLKLTRKSYYSARERGESADALIAFLSDHAQHEVPASVIETIKSWERSYGRAHITQGVTLLQCQDEQVAAAIAGSERCQSYIRSRLGPLAFLIKGDQISNMVRMLESLDIHPCLTEGEEGRKSNPEKAAEAREIQRLIMIHDICSLYKAETQLPSTNEIYAGIEHIPVLWWKETRDYHVSTRKEIIRKAIEWRSYLKLRKAEAEWTVRPIRLDEHAGSWSLSCMEGEREVRLTAEDWDAMQLILPGK